MLFRLGCEAQPEAVERGVECSKAEGSILPRRLERQFQHGIRFRAERQADPHRSVCPADCGMAQRDALAQRLLDLEMTTLGLDARVAMPDEEAGHR